MELAWTETTWRRKNLRRTVSQRSSNRVRGTFLSINRVEGRAYTKRNSSSEPPTKVIRIPKMRATSVYWLTVNQRSPE